MMQVTNFPTVFEEDKNKIFCRVTDIKNVVKFCEYRNHKRLYQRSGNRLFLCTDPITTLRRMIKAGDLYIWTGNRK